MTVNDAAVPDPRVEQRCPPGQEPQGQPFDLASDRRVQQPARRELPLHLPRLADIVRPAAMQRVAAALLVDLRAAGRLSVPDGGDRATWRSGRATGACERTSADSRRAAGIRRITTR